MTKSSILETIKDERSIQLMNMLSNSSAMVLIKDEKDKVVWTNQSEEFNDILEDGTRDDILDCSPSEWLDFIPKDKYAKIDQEVIKTGHSKVNLIEIIHKRKSDDDKQILRIDKLPFITLNGKCEGVITYIINVSTSLKTAVTQYANEIKYLNLRLAINTVITELRK